MRFLSKRTKNRLRGIANRWRGAWVARFRSYDRPRLEAALRRLGLREGDCVMLHSSFGPLTGFRGTSAEVVDVILHVLGPTGNLLMPSLPYRGATSDYLGSIDHFDVRRVPSAMGLLSEFFRRRPSVLRSVNPSHPILATGPDAAWFVAGHEKCVHACGPGSPFEKLLRRDGKVLFFDTPFEAFTFFHYIEHDIHGGFPFRLYEETPFETPVTDAEGNRGTVVTYAFSREAIRRRRFPLLKAELRRRGLCRRRRVGNTTLEIIELQPALAAARGMVAEGRHFHRHDGDLEERASGCPAASRDADAPVGEKTPH